MAVKVSLGKLDIGKPFADVIEDVCENGFELLDIRFTHLLKLEELPFHHRDPFDRLLMAQALVESIPLISADEMFSAYPVQRVW